MTEPERARVGDRVFFDNKRTSWRVRAQTADGRYQLATASMFGQVFYTVMDFTEDVRGPINVIGGGMDIFTTDGPDEAIDEAVAMLEDGWEVSHRSRVPLFINHVKPPVETR